MSTPAIPDADAIVEILKADGAPPRIMLDIGGSADIDGDGIVYASLDTAGELVLEDA